MTRIAEVSDLGKIVRERRKILGYSQQRFADLVGVGRRFLSELENGKTTLNFSKVLRVCRQSGIEIILSPR